MSIETTITKIKRELISSFAVLDGWFDREDEFLREAATGHWTPAEILEHVMLTNHYLLKIIEKGSHRAMELTVDKDISTALVNYIFESTALQEVADPVAFRWERPAHMVPSGLKPLPEIRKELRNQLNRSLSQLDLLSHGQGIFYKMSMSVNNLGKLDVYQYIYFLALYAKRHTAMTKQPQN